MVLAKAFGVIGTPTVFINGRLLAGWEIEDLESLIQNELALKDDHQKLNWGAAESGL